MPRSGWRKPESDRRLSDLVSVGVLMKVFPPEVVDSVITECGRTEQRRRSLPARSMAYFSMGMALHSDGSYEDVLALISDGLSWAERTDGSTGSLCRWRKRTHRGVGWPAVAWWQSMGRVWTWLTRRPTTVSSDGPG